MHERLRGKVLDLWAGMVCRHPWAVLNVAGALALAAAGVAGLGLEFQTDRNDLLSRDLPWNQRFIDWAQSFPGLSDLVVVVEDPAGPEAQRPSATSSPNESEDVGEATGEPSAAKRDAVPADARAAERFVDAAASGLRGHPHVRSIVHGYDPSALPARALILAPPDEFERRLEELAGAEPLLKSRDLADFFARTTEQLRRDASPGAASGSRTPGAENGESAASATPSGRRDLDAVETRLARLAAMVETLNGLAERSDAPADRLARRMTPERPDWSYLRSDGGELLYLRISPGDIGETLPEINAAITSIRRTLEAVAREHPNVDFGVTGVKALEADETRIATRDTMLASLLALLLLAGLMTVAFHSWRLPLVNLVALVIGVAWSIGFATLAVGHLQVLSVTFLVILLGLGIAYGIHLSSRFERVRHQFPEGADGFAAAMKDSFAVVGPGVATGAATTALAFLMTLFTPLKGMGELGLIAAGGVVLCFIAMLTVLPAMMRLVLPDGADLKVFAERGVHLYEERWSTPFSHRPRLTLLGGAVLLAGAGVALPELRFDPDLTRLQPPQAESVVWQNRVSEAGGRAIWYAVSLADDMTQVRRRTRALRSLDQVASVGGAGLLVPPNADSRRSRMLELRRRLLGDQPPNAAGEREANEPVDAAEPTTTGLAEEHELANETGAAPKDDAAGDGPAREAPTRLNLTDRLNLMRRLLPLAVARAPQALRDELSHVARGVERLDRTLAEQTLATRETTMRRLNEAFTLWRDRVEATARDALRTDPLSPKEFPTELIGPYLSDDGRLAMEVFPKAPANVSVLGPDVAPAFFEAVARVDPQITGPLVQVYRSGRLIRESYLLAGVYALLAVTLVVWIDFRSLTDAVFSLLPVVVGFAVTFALLAIVDRPIDPANIIVLPLMFGIGVDSGVHVLHRFRADPDERPIGLTRGTGKGVTLTSLTVIVGFATLMLASHRGIFGLGLVMTVGMLFTMLACWSLMPAWLELRQRRREAAARA